MQMKAVLKTKPEVGAELRLVERPEVTPGHLLVKVLATALCHSDFDVYNYAPSVAAQNLKMPWIMGHEFFGEIVQVGQGVEGFAVGDRIDVVGTSKGKGYAGAIKRWNQHRLRESHGTGPVARHAGSMGSCSTPSRVFKGKRLPGHLGAERVTIQNLKVVKVDAENNLIAIKGAIPGPKGSVVCISDSVKA